jgi:hypothetical protein
MHVKNDRPLKARALRSGRRIARNQEDTDAATIPTRANRTIFS